MAYDIEFIKSLKKPEHSALDKNEYDTFFKKLFGGHHSREKKFDILINYLRENKFSRNQTDGLTRIAYRLRESAILPIQAI
jgi:hypothetical protein